nr:sirohydrochlorin cobaltochelatase [uncultured Cetobacterium sp.]
MNFYNNIKKGAVLLAHFGTTHEDTREKTIDVINLQMKNHFKDLDFYQVYTSRIINRILAKRGVENMNTSQMLEKLKADGYESLIIQPTYIINGTEMEALKREVEIYSKYFKDIRVGFPLLSSPENYIEVIEVLAKEVGELKGNEGVVLVGHGTEHPATSAYPMLDYVAKDMGKPFYIGTVEGYPTVESVIKMLKRDKKDKVVLMPLMFVAGDHAKNDIAEDWKEVLEENGIEVTLNLKGLGEIEGIQNIFLENAKFLEENMPEDILKKKAEYAKGKEANH